MMRQGNVAACEMAIVFGFPGYAHFTYRVLSLQAACLTPLILLRQHGYGKEEDH